MNYFCPVCNGMLEINASCPNCHSRLVESGRIDELYGPYSPYREIDEIKLSNGYTDYKNHSCLHMGFCPICNKNYIITIDEKNF